jgi:L-asparaginase
MADANAIRILVSGGTFDKEYDEITGKLFFRDTHLPEMLALARSQVTVEVEKVFMIDSLEMTDDQREQLLQKCKTCPETKIVLTHGTDTMDVTARKLGDAKLPKTIVLTGAMIPYKFGSSDGLFNLGSAISFCQSLPEGVYVAMNGHYFHYDNFKKDRETGRFVRLNKNK